MSGRVIGQPNVRVCNGSLVPGRLPWGCHCFSSKLGRSSAAGASRARQRRALPDRQIVSAEGGRQSWDFGRFIKTVTYFNEPPTAETVLRTIVQQPAKLVRQLTGQDEEMQSAVLKLMTSNGSQGNNSSSNDVVLVAGATGGVGKRVVQTLLKQGKAVRALVRDEGKARKLLGSLAMAQGGSLEVAVGDITKPNSLKAEMFQGVQAVICCTAVKVSPKEGDNASRDKYNQGIRFYEPEVVGATPEAVEYHGMQNLLSAVKEHVGYRHGKLIFSADGQGLANVWGPLDDVVMGGVSESGFEVRAGAGEHNEPAGVFSGLVSDSNSGGFASVRTKNFTPALDLKAYGGLAFRVKGDGLRYKCTLRTDTNWDGIGYTLSFDTKDGEWHDVQLPFQDFIPLFRAKTVKDGSKLDPSTVTSVQLMLSKFENDGKLNPSFKTGPFQLPLAKIWGYAKEPQAARFVLVSSAGVTRPNRPGIDLSQEPPAVRMNGELGGILTYKLKGEDEVRQSGVPFAVVRPCALTEEPAGAELVLSQGDTIKGKVSREDIAELCVQLLSQQEGLDKTFEVKSTVPFSQPFEVDQRHPPASRDWQALFRTSNLDENLTGKTKQSELHSSSS